MKITKIYDYGGKHYVLCAVGTNGFIVTVYLIKELVMKKLEIILDLGDGPVVTKYYDEKSDRLLTAIDVVDNDEFVKKQMMKFKIYIHHIIKLITMMNPYILTKTKNKKMNIKCLNCLENL